MGNDESKRDGLVLVISKGQVQEWMEQISIMENLFANYAITKGVWDFHKVNLSYMYLWFTEFHDLNVIINIRWIDYHFHGACVFL